MDRTQSPTLWIAAFGAALFVSAPCAALQVDETEPRERDGQRPARSSAGEIAPLWAFHAIAPPATWPRHDAGLGGPIGAPGTLSPERADARAVSRFSEGRRKKQKPRFKKDFEIFKYRREFTLGQREMVFKVKVPGKRKAWARFQFEF